MEFILAIAPSSIHDFVPGIWMDVRDTFGPGAYDVTIFFVKRADIPMRATANDAQLEGHAGYGPEFWARNIRKRVVGNVIDPR